MIHCVKSSMPTTECFKARNTMSMKNVGKAIFKESHSYFLQLYCYFYKIIRSKMFKFDKILLCNYNLRLSIKSMKVCQLVLFSKSSFKTYIINSQRKLAFFLSFCYLNYFSILIYMYKYVVVI